MFENSKWIWINNVDNEDEYADFLVEFSLDKIENVNLNISVDGNFEAYLNGELCAIGSCADYPFHKCYDVFPLDKLCKIGKNELKITVWHIGNPSSTYVKAEPGVIFEISQNKNTVASSNENVSSRMNPNYTNGLCKRITSQLGLSYRYDNTLDKNAPFGKSVLVDKTNNIFPRKIENLKLLPRIPVEVNDDGNRLLIDFGKECAGHLDLDFISEEDQELLIVFGEHLDDNGRVPRIIGPRDFSVEFVANKGNNKFFGGMRRIAGRYLEIEYKKPIKLGYIGIKPIVYPLNIKEKVFDNELHQRIYDTSVHTLICCMHEHYEDCPWREQALYSLDSRNQMLCGYIAFEEYRYARYNIVLLARSLHNGLIRITSPTMTDLPIPFFSLTFIQQVYDYVKYSGDKTVIDEVSLALDSIINTLKSLIDESGMIPALKAPAWNFYEWSDGNTGYGKPLGEMVRYDICLNAMFLYVLPMYEEMRMMTDVDKKALSDGILHVLFDAEKEMFMNSSEDNRVSIIGNSLAILAGVGGKDLAEKLISKRGEITDVTLSMNSYFYDALLTFGDTYKKYIINDIEEKYGYMLSCGATTFWETIDGWRAFSDAGSLCHGWSALPVYYFDLLL